MLRSRRIMSEVFRDRPFDYVFPDNFNPSRLFSKATTGVFFDPSDLSTMFADTAGTIPAAVGDSIARINDKSGHRNHATQAVLGSRPVLQQDVNGLYYLDFAGVDDFVQTGILTPNVNKVQMFVGMRKMNDAAGRGSVVAYSGNPDTNNGTFQLLAPQSTTGLGNYQFTSRGTVTDFLSGFTGANNNYPSPETRVVTGLADIAAPSVALRLNGSTVVSGTANQGTGNYANQALFIGRRGGTAFPFVGRIYSLIVRFGPNLTPEQISATEAWVNSKTGAY